MDPKTLHLLKQFSALRCTWVDQLQCLVCVGEEFLYFPDKRGAGAVGLSFAVTDYMSEQLRGKKDLWNSVYGGAAAGLLIGARGLLLLLLGFT